ncbi:transposase [Catellatospora sp. NPDC049609]|uniref:IS110 family transposase n=1 Tax=Catellatospora sp. NPDC049609 TaxID=3155505 RepID=UPI0034164B19
MAGQLDRAWVGIDVGKTHHWACVVDSDGKRLLSTKIGNDEVEIVALVTTAGNLASQLTWAVDISGRARPGPRPRPVVR